ncbi:UNVERIFIED_CONTAM: class II heat shock protein [Sesamum angustifolium]|uniref:Class II heat shock protein n=1 Tax=Sesamum angustifolium TaxID=2727405 RepID=A0AAW2MAH1_9LAMI
MLESDAHKSAGGPTRTYVLDAKAMAATPPTSKPPYVFVVDMPGLKPGEIVQVGTIMCFSSAASAGRERGGQVRENGAAGGEVHAVICVAGGRKHG